MNNKQIDINKPRAKSSSGKKKILTDDDIMKYEIASELGLMDKVSELGWGGLTAKEAGRIGGMLTSRKKKKKKIEKDESDGSV
ncbi:Small acid-soluble spore protein [[Clostridium] sordellii]|uniref:small, acid-soluble spore protein, alpha/beta type n=1 Tax=Paraclostridium sordellii TaxID=1505 RepID=UPI0005E392BB|nr:small, acid-soluble spore protein, alpha/beta type [Paeniclostridium sordellii]MBX9182227.1 small, acid-soluble spore protein, alpha/beta type [Paeniclostridium sordellii]MDU1454476.1 small, acid-soluble spore protein, alpha/beta type [Paeniclostridium sordellii]MDU2688134.1 small, acid-soluble spore protein, alpha/beta type [Paeniclostridium sordellii]RGX11509.1 small, acid-soluble spore protein, alpha/beta type [Paeniclostridium sordellii]CEN76862.1 Small acid-soluble spore protein [[Clos